MTRSDYWADRADRDREHTAATNAAHDHDPADIVRDLCRTHPTAVIAACNRLAWRQTTREGKT